MGAITGKLGTRWSWRAHYKPYPAGIVMHAVIDACLQLRAQGLRADQVASVTVRGDQLLLARGDRAVANERDAKVSNQHCVAAALLRGAAGVAEFAAGFVADPATAALRAKVTCELDASCRAALQPWRCAPPTAARSPPPCTIHVAASGTR